MKIVGLDLGSRTVGVAISDNLGIIATPVETFRINDNDLQDALHYVKMFIEENKVEKIVLGLPINMNGTYGPSAEMCLAFKELLEKELNMEVIMIDERMTSIMANNALINADMSRNKRKENVDKIAASIILQTYLDQHR